MSTKAQERFVAFTPEDFMEEQAEEQAKIVLSRNPGSGVMTDRQHNLALEMVKHPDRSFREKKIAAGYSPNSNDAALKKQLQGKLGKTLADVGVTEITLGQVIAEGLQANRQIVYRETERDPETGKILKEQIKLIPIPDHNARATFVKIAADLTGLFAPKKIDHTHRTETVMRKIYQVYAQIPREILEERYREARERGIDVGFEILDEDE